MTQTINSDVCYDNFVLHMYIPPLLIYLTQYDGVSFVHKLYNWY